MFSWKDASEEECAWHIAKATPQQTTSVIAYYKKKDDEEMLTKIYAARKLAKLFRTILRGQEAESVILQEGLESATNLISTTTRVG